MTPQNTSLLRRFAAMVYDTLLIFAFLVILAILANSVLGGENVYAGGPVFVRAYNAVRFLVIFLFFVIYWSTRGRTLGMQSWGLQLQTTDGQIPSLSTASIRFFAAIISWLPLGLGFVWQLWDKDKLTWHDRISGTRLVYYPKTSS
jgi:uncharacterized RDD family membrane protein YckC